MSNQCILNIAKPARVLLIPLDCCLKTLLPVHLLLPSQLVQLAAVDCVPQVVEPSILDEGDEPLFLVLESQDLDKPLCHLKVANLVVTTNVQDLTGLGLVENDLKGARHVLNVEEVACVAAIAMQSHGPSPQKLVGELRNQLLRELVRTIHVVPTGDDAGQFERPVVRLHQELRPSLRRSIRVGGLENMLLLHGLRFKRLSLTVNLVS
mmetsp:Transcript_12975/g.28011  ORF Transcript_12975/g.28011 Transcript_12975/m.28011 type:complete len:208 (-) Transcript_12975:838-1461(-)